MNRIKLWLYVVLLLGAGAGNLYFVTRWITARSIAQADRELRSASALADARIRLLGAAVESAADTAARAPAVIAAMADPAASPLGPAEEAVAGAATGLSPELARSRLVAVGAAHGLEGRSGGADGKTVAVPEALIAQAQAGRRSQAWVKLDGALWIVAAVPVGRGGAVAVGLPLDAQYLRALVDTTSANLDVVAVVDSKPAAATVAADQASAVATLGADWSEARLAKEKPVPVDVGRMGRVKPALSWVSSMPLLLVDPPAARALAVPIPGAGAAALVLVYGTSPLFSGLAAYQILALIALALFLLVGVLLSLLMREESPGLPRELVSSADRIARGDFSVRAPALAGAAGTIATALNRAAEAAQHPAAARSAEPAHAAEPSPVAGPVPTDAAAEPTPAAAEPSPASMGAADAFAVTQPIFPAAAEAAPATATPAEPTAAAEASERGAPSEREAIAAARDAELGTHGVVPVREPEPAVEASASPAPEEPAPAEAAAAPEEPAPAEAPQALDEDERHWRSVFDDFVRLRSVTGEAAENVSYDRFRAKLERNREQLREKHGARTVRFQPYVKDGKVALRATPVK